LDEPTNNVKLSAPTLLVGRWRSQPISTYVRSGFQVQNPSDADMDLPCDQNYQLL